MLMPTPQNGQRRFRSTAEFADATQECHVIDQNSALIRQRPEWLPEVLLIAGEWDRDGQNVRKRPLVIHRQYWPDNWRRQVVVAIDGTPCRGQIIVPSSAFEPVVRISQEIHCFKHDVDRRLRSFADELCSIIWPDTPNPDHLPVASGK